MAAASCLALGGCAHVHQVGVGSTGVAEDTQRQYYILFGLYRINDADVMEMAAGQTGYDVYTRTGLYDLLLLPLLLPLTCSSRTVTVRR